MDVEDTLHKAGPSKRGPVCQVPGCNTDLSGYKGYHQRYKICEEHFRMPSMVLQGQVVRFCQQCGKFQPIEEFTNDRRSCSVQLALHAGRRRRRHALARAKKLEALKQRISGSASEDSDGMDEDMDEDEGQSGTGRYGSGARTAGSGKRAGGPAFSSHSTGGTDGRLSGLTVSEVRMLRQLIKSQKEGGQEKGADAVMQSAGSGMLPSPMFMPGAGASAGPLLQPGSAPPSFLTASDGVNHPGGLTAAALCLAGQQPGLGPQQLATGPGVMMMDWAMGSGSEQGVGMAAAAMLSQAGSLPAAMPSSGDSLQTRFHSMVHLPAGPGMGSVSGPTMVLQHGGAPQQLAAPMQLVWGEGGQLQLLQPQQPTQQQPQLPPPQPLQLEQAHSMASAPAASAATSPAAMAVDTANGTAAQPTGTNAPEAAASQQGPNSESSCGVNSAPAAVAAGQAVTASEQQQQQQQQKDATANGEQAAAAGVAAGAQAVQPGMDTSSSHTVRAAAATVGSQPSCAPAAAASTQAGAAGSSGAAPLLAAVAAASTSASAVPGVSAATHSTASRMAMQVAREMQAQMSAFSPLPNNPLAAAMMGAPGPGVALSSAVSLGSGALVSSMGQGVRQLGRVVEILPPGASIPGLPTPPGSAPTIGPAGATAAAGSAGSLPMLPMQWPGGLPTGGLGSMDSRLHALSLAGSLPAQQLGSGLGSSLGSGFGSGLNSQPELMGGLQAGGNGLPMTLLPNGGGPAFNGLQAFVAGPQAPAAAAPPSMFQLPGGVPGLQQMQQQMQQQMVSGVQLLPGLGALGSAPGLQVPGSGGLMHLLSTGAAQGAAPAGLQQLQQQLQQQQQQVAQLGGFSLALQQPQQQQQQQQGLQAAAAAAAAAGGVRVISQDQLQQLLAQGVQVTELRAL